MQERRQLIKKAGRSFGRLALCAAAWIILAGATTPALGSAVALPEAAETTLAIIVHPTRAGSLSRDDVASMFLKKRRFWEDGAPIVPLNREPGSEAREVFSRRVLESSSVRLAAYWNKQYSEGIFPPTTLKSSAAVKRYVAANPDAIGYIDVSEVDDSVHVVLTIP